MRTATAMMHVNIMIASLVHKKKGGALQVWFIKRKVGRNQFPKQHA
jgi:hypothetical protein